MYLDFPNNTSTTLLNPYNKLYSSSSNKQPTIWKNISTYPNRTKSSFHNNNHYSNQDDFSIKFVLKNDATKVTKPVKVFSLPIVDKISPTKSSNADSKKRKHASESDETESSEYVYKDKKSGGGSKNKNKRFCKPRRGIGHKLKKIGKYLIPAGIGFLTFKMILVPVVLKILAIMSAKGVFLGMVSFVMASLLSLKQIVGTTGRHDKKSDITFIPISIRKSTDKHKYNKHDEYLEYEPNPYHSDPYGGHYDYGN